MKDIEEKEKSEKKSSRLLVTIIVVLLMGACVGGGYLLGATNVLKINSDNNKSNIVTEKKDDEVKENNEVKENGKVKENGEVKEDSVVKNDNIIVNHDRSEAEIIFDNLDSIGSSADGRCEGYIFEYYTDHKVTVNDISNDLVSSVVLEQLKNSGLEFRKGVTFTKAQVKDIITKTFGKNYSYAYKSIDYCPGFTYDSGTEIYTVQGSGCGGTCLPGIIKKMDSYEVKGNNLEIMVRVLFSNLDPNNFKFYSDYNKTRVADIDTNNLKNDDNFSKGGLYKLVFTKEDGNYVFVSSEPVNQ